MAYGTRRFNAAFTRALQSGSEALCDVSEHPCFYSLRLLASRQTPMLEDHSWLAVHDCLFNIFAGNLHIWKPTPPFASRGDASRIDKRPSGKQILIDENEALKSKRVF